MANILICWELGAGRGHLTPQLALARHLRDAGHDVLFAVRQLQHAETLLGCDGFCYVQAPTWIGTGEGPGGAIRTYAQVLLNVGFADPDHLVGRIRAWRQLFAWHATDLLVTDHSPTALLAARGLDLPAAAVGNGFFVPPLQAPLPALAGELDAPALADEARALDHANRALATVGGPPMARLADLFDVALRVVRTWPEFDHYPDRDDVLYVPLLARIPGAAPTWPEAPGAKLFAYLRPGPLLTPVLTVLTRRRLPALVTVEGVTSEVIERFSSPTLTLSDSIYDLGQVAARADLALLNANHSTTLALLAGGCPVLLLPQQLEQALFARRVAALGVGLVVDEPRQTAVDLALEALLQQPRYRAVADELARRHAGHDYAAAERDLAARIGALAGMRIA
jgi:UDP:flavonoid glycosyltransferase YjiC (YdhE family)